MAERPQNPDLGQGELFNTFLKSVAAPLSWGAAGAIVALSAGFGGALITSEIYGDPIINRGDNNDDVNRQPPIERDLNSFENSFNSSHQLTTPENPTTR